MLTNKLTSILLLIILLLLSGISYFLFGIHMQTKDFPNCSATIRYLDAGIDNSMELNIFNSARHHVSFTLRGTIHRNGQTYTLFRNIKTFYEGNGSRYIFKTISSSIDPLDNVPEDISKNNPFLRKERGFYFTINRLDAKNIFFMVNNMPVFVCTQIEY